MSCFPEQIIIPINLHNTILSHLDWQLSKTLLCLQLIQPASNDNARAS